MLRVSSSSIDRQEVEEYFLSASFRFLHSRKISDFRVYRASHRLLVSIYGFSRGQKFQTSLSLLPTTQNRRIFYRNLRMWAAAAAIVASTTLGGDRVQRRKEKPKPSKPQDRKEQARQHDDAWALKIWRNTKTKLERRFITCQKKKHVQLYTKKIADRTKICDLKITSISSHLYLYVNTIWRLLMESLDFRVGMSLEDIEKHFTASRERIGRRCAVRLKGFKTTRQIIWKQSASSDERAERRPRSRLLFVR